MSYTLHITGSVPGLVVNPREKIASHHRHGDTDAIARVWETTRVCGLTHTRVGAPR